MSTLLKFRNKAILVFMYVLLTVFLLSPAVFAASVTLAWDKPDNNGGITGYNIYYGLSQTSYKDSPRIVINSPDQTQVVISDLEEGNLYLFAATSHDGKGRESEFSEELQHQVPIPPNSPPEDPPSDESPGNPGAPPADPLDLPPYKPVLSGPADNRNFSSNELIRFKTQEYTHPGENAHLNSRWQVRRFDKKKPLYDKISDTDLTDHVLDTALKSGLKYAWRVGFQDTESGLIAWSDEKYFVVGENIKNTEAPHINPGKLANEYKMVSFVQWLPDSCSEKTFSPLMNADYASGDYKIAAYDPALNGNGGYREYADFEVEPGRAYWVLARNGMHLSVEGVPVTTEEDLFVPLDYDPSSGNGWSMIAVPNNALYQWGNVEIIVHDEDGDILYGPIPMMQLEPDNEFIDKRVWVWENQGNGGYTAHNSMAFELEPYGGYWVKAKAKNVSLSFPYDAQKNSSGPDFLLTGLWRSGINWIGDKLSPRSVFADYQLSGYDESPPMPLGGLDENNDPDDDSIDDSTTSKKSSDSGCFIGTIGVK